jgi:lycopene cyclase CruP
MKDPVLSAKPGPVVVRRLAAGQRICSAHDCDVCVAGGTLGIFLALALQLKGHRVCVVEKRTLQGRSQEWNISRAELHGLVDAGMLTQDELDAAIVTHWDESCIHFKDGGDALRVKDVLNLGVSPRILIDSMKARFLAAGGQIFEHTAFKSAEVADDGIKVQLQSTPASDVTLTPGDVNRPSAVGKGSTPFTHGNGNINGNINGNHSAPRPTIPRTLTARLLVDVMGHYSPIVKQVRGGQRPDGMVVVVGGCMDGIPAEANTSADLLATITDSFDDTQLFWEAFPAEGGASRTAYMFLYTDAKPSRPNFVDLIQLYLKMLPHYQVR